ncbi:FG-GAP repeat domain-containing protein [Streptomyces sp. NPDC058872]|uniref:FG-GAP repeat domain-containing protein n=1 Tax=Streptomyces sp. NPDC058872 TaxID=3346661 RepID=UPI0036BCFA7E
MQHQPSARRIAAALAVVLAVTGTALTSVPATAAPTAVRAATGTTGAAAISVGDGFAHEYGWTSGSTQVLDADAEVVSAGPSGYLTSRKDEGGATVLEWHKASDGSITPMGSGPRAYDTNSDIVVTGDGTGFSLRDMKDGSVWSAYLNIAYEFKPGTKLVGVVRDALFVSVPTTEDYDELWQLRKVNGVSQKVKLSSRPKNVDYKVVASAGTDLIVLGATREPYIPTDRIVYWWAKTNINNNAVVDWGGSSGTLAWDQSSTGALTGTYRAWVNMSQFDGTPEISVSGGADRRIPLTGGLTGAVVAGIVGDTILYGVPGTATGETPRPLYAQSLTDSASAPYKVLDNFSTTAHDPDGSLLVRGFGAAGDGVFRISDSGGARPAVSLEASTGRSLAVQVTGTKVPTSASLEKPGSTVPMEWTLSRSATVDLTLTHTATGKKLTQRLQPTSGYRYAFAWNGVLGGASAPNGTYLWEVTATPTDGVGGPATASGKLQVTRTTNPHDYGNNGSTDVLARDSSGVLWRDDLYDWPVNGQVKTAGRARIGGGWNTYDQVEAVGNIGGAAVGDLVARDKDGVLWEYLGKGDGTFAPRTKIGGGWNAYRQIAGGSDLDGDGKADLVAFDASGDLWFYHGTGDWKSPFAPRKKVGWGWNIYNQITAVGNIAGTGAGDLVARDKDGVLWLYQGTGNGTFATRTRIGGGWNAFTHLVGAGDADADGRPDLIAYGAGGTYVYHSTGSTSAPFTRTTTDLYAGEGTAFSSVS